MYLTPRSQELHDVVDATEKAVTKKFKKPDAPAKRVRTTEERKKVAGEYLSYQTLPPTRKLAAKPAAASGAVAGKPAGAATVPSTSSKLPVSAASDSESSVAKLEKELAKASTLEIQDDVAIDTEMGEHGRA